MKKKNKLDKRQQVQESEYVFPYHYLDLKVEIYKYVHYIEYLTLIEIVKNLLKPFKGQKILDVVWDNYADNLKKIVKLDYEETGTYYKFADVFAYFPTFYELFGRTLIEAKNQGTPVVVYPIAGIKEIAKHKKNGLLVKSRNPKKIGKEIEKDK